MASRYWVGGTATWDATAGSKWATTSGGAGGAAVPTLSDDVFFDASSGAVTVTTTGAVSVCKSLNCTGFTGTLSLPVAGNAITVTEALTFVSGMTLVNGGSLTAIILSSTSDNGGAGWPITTGGKTMPGLSFTGTAGKWLFQDAVTATDGTGAIVLTSGTLDTNNQAISCRAFSSSNSNTRTLTLGSSTITCNASSSNSWDFTGSNITFTANTASITISGATSTFRDLTAAHTYGGTISQTGSGTCTLNAAGHTVANYTRTGTAAKTDALSLSATAPTITGTLTLSGNSPVNRLLVQSNTPGTARSITCNGTVSASNVDFMDITGVGSASWNLAAITGGSGDCQGNSGITFTTPATQTRSGAGGNWSTSGNWTSRVPLPQDNVVVNAGTTGTLVTDMPRLGADIDFTGFAGTFSNTGGFQSDLFGSLIFASGMTIAGSNGLRFMGRGTHTVTSNGKQFIMSVAFQGPNGTYTLQDAFVTQGSLNVNDGTFTTNNNAVTCSTFTAGSGRTTILNLGTSTIALTNTSGGTVFSVAATATTLNAGTSNLVPSAASTNNRTINLANGKTLYNFTYTVANSPGSLTITNGSGSTGSFNTFSVTSGRTLIFPANATTAVNTWNVSGQNNGYQYFAGATSNYASAPDSTALSVTGDIDIRVRVALDDWTPATSQGFINKYDTGQQSYFFYVVAAGQLAFRTSLNGSSDMAVTSTNSVSFTNGTAGWVRVTRSAATGAVLFYEAADSVSVPSSWTQLGATIGTQTAGSIFDSTTELRVPNQTASVVGVPIGKFYRALVYNGIAGTIVFDADFTAKPFGANTFTESSANAATVTINGALAQVGDGRVAITSSTPGTAATLSSAGNQSSDYLTIQDSTAQGANWYAGTHSLDNGNNHGWLFNTTTPPSTKGNFTLFGGPN